MSPNTNPILLSVVDAAKMLGISRSTAYKLMDDGTLKTMKLRGRRMVLRRPLERMVLEADGKRPVGRPKKS